MNLRVTLAGAVAATVSVTALGGAAGGATSAASPGTATVSVALGPVAGEQVRGGVTLAGSGGRTNARLSLAGLPPGARALARVHAGDCASLDRVGASFALLAVVTADASGRVQATARIVFRGHEDVPLSALTDGEHVIVVVLDRGVVACGAVPGRESRPVVVGAAIGAVAIGMDRADVIRADGSPRSASTFTFRSADSARVRATGGTRRPPSSSTAAGRWCGSRPPRALTRRRASSKFACQSPPRRGSSTSSDLREGGYSRRANGALTSFIPCERLVPRIGSVNVDFFEC